MAVVPFNGFLIVDKPADWTSRRCVDVVERLVRPAKAGHAGTLDPMATGVLVVAIGSGTRLIPEVQSMRKSYEATFQLGLRSDTEDVTGQLLPHAHPFEISYEVLNQAIGRLTGKILQQPSKFSAIKINGQRAYDLARKGLNFELAPRPVEIYMARIVQYSPPCFQVQLECSSGTYVRSWGRDIGEALGCGAVMTSLRRTKIGHFALSEAISPEPIDLPKILDNLRPNSFAVSHWPQWIASAEQAWRLNQGQKLKVAGLTEDRFAVDHEGRLLALAEYTKDDETFSPRVVFHEAMNPDIPPPEKSISLVEHRVI